MRNYGLIRGLSERHQVSLLSFCEPMQKPKAEVPAPLIKLCHSVEVVPAPQPRPLTRRALDTLTHRLPDMGLRLASSTFADRLAEWLAREVFDVVHVEGLEMTPYLDLLLDDRDRHQAHTGQHSQRRSSKGGRSRRGSPLVIFDDHNCEYMLQKRYAQVDARIPRRWAGAFYSLIQWQKLRRYEANVCRRSHHVLAVSLTDARALQQLVTDLEVTVIPNGIDVDAYEQTAPPLEDDPGAGQPVTVVFTGKMDFRPNVDAVSWFAEVIWPRVQAEVPEARFFAVGQRPHPQLNDLRADPTVTLTGWVEDVRPYITKAAVYVAPLRMGSGTRLKLLEAMALGKAIVSTRMGSEGLTHEDLVTTAANTAGREAAHDQELVLVNDNDPAAFADSVIALLRDPLRRASLGAAARAFVRAHYDWRVIIPRLEELYARGAQTQ